MTQDTFDYIKIGCEISSTSFSIIAIAISVYSLILRKSKNKNDTLLAIKGYIQEARSNLSKISLEISKNKPEHELCEIEASVFSEAQERMLNAYELACERFYKKELDENDFYDNFADSIETFMKNKNIEENYFSGDVAPYYYIPKYYREYIRKEKSSKR